MGSEAQTSQAGPNLPSWQNVHLKPGDEEIAWIDRLERRADPIPSVGWAIRNLITRFEVCHFKAERHVQRIIEAIGNMSLDLNPASIGKAHPRFGENAWVGDQSGRSRQGQEFIWALQRWLSEEHGPDQDSPRIPRTLFDEVKRTLGDRTAPKSMLVSALVARMLLREDRQPLPSELAAFWEPIERTDLCHYSFPANVEKMICAIGRLEQVPDFVGCGSCDETRSRMAREYFRNLCAWLRGRRSSLASQLGERSPVKEWLAACLAKTLKEHAGLRGRMPSL